MRAGGKEREGSQNSLRSRDAVVCMMKYDEVWQTGLNVIHSEVDLNLLPGFESRKT